jgi:hypothetical protein
MQTLGSLIDALCTVDLKMWNAQEGLYAIRHMTFQEFRDYISDVDGQLKLFEHFKKSCDLNYLRSELITEIDQMIVKIIEDALEGKDLSKHIVLAHKTY